MREGIGADRLLREGVSIVVRSVGRFEVSCGGERGRNVVTLRFFPFAFGWVSTRYEPSLQLVCCITLHTQLWDAVSSPAGSSPVLRFLGVGYILEGGRRDTFFFAFLWAAWRTFSSIV